MTSPQNQRRRRPEDELELLSAYLDNALDAAERRNLERELEREPRLRNELTELRATVYAIGELEPMRPPRSFTLDPSNPPLPLPQPTFWQQLFQPGGSLAGIFQLGSGLVGMALILLATVQLMTVTVTHTNVSYGLGEDAPAGFMATAAVAGEAAPEVGVSAAAPEAAPAPMALPTEEIMIGAAAAGAAPDPRTADSPDATMGQAPVSEAVPASEAARTQAAPAEPSPTQPARLGWMMVLALGIALLGMATGWSAYSYWRQRE